jgi:DNA processing protein
MPVTTIDTTLAWAVLNILTKKRYNFLMQKFGSLEEAWIHLDAHLLKTLGCKEETIHKVINEVEELNIEQQLQFLGNHSIQFLTIEEEGYPEPLTHIADPPVFLFARGNMDCLRHPSIAIVGTRDMSTYGKRVVETLVPVLVHSGITTVSGLALGIDAEVAKQTIAAGGMTIAVLGHGLGAIYPKANARLAEEIMKNDGLLLTEYPLHIRPDKYTFPARNRIIAGLTHGTIVAEAAAQSGSLITASLAMEYGKEVFAVPGQIFDPHCEGTHRLIQQGAKLVHSADDVLSELGIIPRGKESTSTYRAQTPEEQMLLSHLSSMPQIVDDMVEKSKLPIAVINATLTLMELKGGAKNIGSGQWVKT